MSEIICKIVHLYSTQFLNINNLKKVEKPEKNKIIIDSKILDYFNCSHENTIKAGALLILSFSILELLEDMFDVLDYDSYNFDSTKSEEVLELYNKIQNHYQ